MEEMLIEAMRIELEKLHSAHPYLQPGLWDIAVDNIRAIRATIYANQGHEAQKRLSAAMQGNN